MEFRTSFLCTFWSTLDENLTGQVDNAIREEPMFKSKQQKEELAKRLGVNVRALEQYMHLKRVESGAPSVAIPKIDREALESQRPVKRDISY